MNVSYWITSPPARVIRAFNVLGSICFLIARTEPSQNRTLNPSGHKPPRAGIAPLRSNGISSGLVQGTFPCHSTARIVFDVPSVIWLNVASVFLPPATHGLPSAVASPANT